MLSSIALLLLASIGAARAVESMLGWTSGPAFLAGVLVVIVLCAPWANIDELEG